MYEEVLAHFSDLRPSNEYRPRNPVYADQICVSHTIDDRTELSYIIEYKAPHKLTPQILRVGLRDMNLATQVIQRATIPTDPQGKFEYHAEKFVAAAMTQTYMYMLESGLEFSCIITGEAIVFLWIREEEPNTLYYHLTEPKEEVDTGDGFQHSLTAVSQLLSLCLLSIRSTRRSQRWRNAAIADAQTWTVNWQEILRGMPEDEDMEAPPSAYKARTYEIERSPYQLRYKRGQSSLTSCKPDPGSHSDSDDSPGDADHQPDHLNTPSRKREPRASATEGEQRRRGAMGSSSSGSKQRQYCTQRCLLGLARKSVLDQSCPNATLHCRGDNGQNHLLNKQEFSDLVRLQLATSLDENVEELGKQGSRGALFRIVLESHGYVFVAKATREVFVPALQHEGRIYERLQSMQGKTIPVYLGNIDLDQPWRDLHVRLNHMLLMSWAGQSSHEVEGVKDLRMQIQRFEKRTQRLGVLHNDLVPRNILWNNQLQRVMFIDFERATETGRQALQEVSINRKRKQIFEKEAATSDPVGLAAPIYGQ